MSFFNSLSFEFRIAWEFRRNPEDLPDSVVRFMIDSNIIQVVDLSWEDLRYENDVMYTRIFGDPARKFVLSNDNVNTIKKKVSESKSLTAM